MFQQPDFTENVSVKLSEVLADIGVDERIVLKRRRAWLLIESMRKLSGQLQDVTVPSFNLYTLHYFGSQSEGTTTKGLNSDTDELICLNPFNVIQNGSDWEFGKVNQLMIQDETVPPGYCLLQRLRDDAPFPYNGVPSGHFFFDRTGRVLSRNTIMFAAAANAIAGVVRHGPAYTEHGQLGLTDADTVLAYPCKSWPVQARHWLDKQRVGQWPSDDIRRYCSTTGCFVVGVGSKESENEELEWRISTSRAERCLMFNLNITRLGVTSNDLDEDDITNIYQSTL